ncbi:MAG: class I SAM-dependent methyltransferase [Candidatus Promineifilaceae bacterium]
MSEKMEDKTRQQSFAERYATGQIPWADRLPPPELMALANELAPGRALDLGSGYGRTSIFLAQHGWQVDAVEFVPQAVEEARHRAVEAGVGQKTNFHNGDVTDLSFLQGYFDLAVDIGCMHSLKMPDLVRYHAELKRLLRMGATYLLFAHLFVPEQEHRDPAPSDDVSSMEDAARWITEPDLRALFADGFWLSQVDHGITKVPDSPSWPSAWFYFQRR